MYNIRRGQPTSYTPLPMLIPSSREISIREMSRHLKPSNWPNEYILYCMVHIRVPTDSAGSWVYAYVTGSCKITIPYWAGNLKNIRRKVIGQSIADQYATG